MTKRIYFIYALIFLGFYIKGGTAFCQEAGSCGRCHQKEQAIEADRIHSQGDVGCTDCHGGNPKESDKEKAHSESALIKVERREIPKLCGDCHSDVRRMNTYGLPTDQYSQYLTSKHGEVLAEGKTDVATCIDCHGVHGIKRVRDPQSPVYPKNVPDTCGKCHANKELMDKYDVPVTAEPLYRQSIHADLLFNKDDLSAPTCVTCHGNHGATPPGFSDISHVCGKCHIKQQDLFKESPHASLIEEGVFKGCVTCHSNHKISRTPEEIFRRCNTCHEGGDKAIQTRDAIFSLIKSTEDKFQESKDMFTGLKHAGFHTEDEELLLEEAKTYLLQLPPLQHTLDVVKVMSVASSADTVLSEIQKRLTAKEKAEHIKKFALLPIWLFLIAMAIVFWLKRKEIEKAGKET